MLRYSLWIIFALLLTTPSTAFQDTSDLFDVSSTSLNTSAAAKFAADLVEYAQGRVKASPEYALTGDYRHLVRLAYELAPESPTVVAAHARIKKGFPPEAPKRDVAAPALVTSLLALVKPIEKSTAAPDLKAAQFIHAVGLMIDPQSNACLVQSEILQKRLGQVPWAKALSVYRREPPDGHTSAINGLVVMTAGGTTQVGQVSKILLTYRKQARAGLEVKFLRESGGMMVVSMEEALRYWNRLRTNLPLPNGTIEISFEDKFTKKDGPSAGAAYTVLMRSFSDPFQIDPAFAMTGDISVEGKILQVGGVFAKVRGGLQGKCTRVGIPATNEQELTDAILLNGPLTLAEVEVYGMEMIEHAIALARTDKDPAVEKASALFAGLLSEVRKKLESKDPKDKASSPDIQQMAQAILALQPRHLSARLLDAWNGGRLPPTLTLAGSLEESGNTFYKYLVTISPKGTPNFGEVQNETKTAQVSATLKSLRDLRPKLHPDAVKPSQKLEEVCTTIYGYIAAIPDVEEKEKRVETYTKSIENYRLKIEKAKAERQPVDAVNRLVKQHNDAVQDHKNAVDRYNKAVSDRQASFQNVVQVYNEYSGLVRAVTQDPKLLEKLIHGK